MSDSLFADLFQFDPSYQEIHPATHLLYVIVVKEEEACRSIRKSIAMTDLGVFSDKDFDPKAYINAACTNKPSDQPLDRLVSLFNHSLVHDLSSFTHPLIFHPPTALRYLAELEMKLHLGSEDINLYLQDQAYRATQRIPVAARELARIREDAQAVRSSVSSALVKLNSFSSPSNATTTTATTAATLTALKEIDSVKQRMESARSTLKEAAGLSTLFHLVDDLFASGDLPRAADALAGIRRGLAVVADSVPEFRDGPARLCRLEDRFSAAAESPLAAAFSAQRGDEASALASMLTDMGRTAQVQKSYVAARSAPLRALWEGYTQGTPFVSWISTFYDQILKAVAAECGWCHLTLSSLYPDMILALLHSFFTSIDKPHRARLAGALTGAQGSILPLEHLEQSAAAAADFVNGLRNELSSANAMPDPRTMHELLVLIVAPLEGAIAQYHEKELMYLTAEVPRTLSRARELSSSSFGSSSSTKNTTTTVQSVELSNALSASIDPTFAALTASVARCQKLTNGTSLPSLSRVLDRVLQQYILAVQSIITTAHQHQQLSTGLKNSTAAAIPSPESVLPLLMIVQGIKSKLDECGRAVATAAADLSSLLERQDSQQQEEQQEPMSLAVLRVSSQPLLQQQLSSFTAVAGKALPAAHASLEDLAAIVDALAERSLCGKVAALFASVSNLAEWQAQPTTSVPLPNFTPYPLQYVTAAGEYLMMMPQVLESALAAVVVAPLSISAPDGSGGGSGGGRDELLASPKSPGEKGGAGAEAEEKEEEGEEEEGVAAVLVAEWDKRRP